MRLEGSRIEVTDNHDFAIGGPVEITVESAKILDAQCLHLRQRFVERFHMQRMPLRPRIEVLRHCHRCQGARLLALEIHTGCRLQPQLFELILREGGIAQDIGRQCQGIGQHIALAVQVNDRTL
ncbi:hypothetical protein D3C81_1154120 [compost metagenome]